MNKKQISRVALTLLIMLTPLSTWAAEVGDVFTVDGLKYTITSESPDYTVELTKYDTTKPTGELIIPSSVVNGEIVYTVASIGGYAFNDCPNITSLVIPSTIATIGQSAFFKCTSLESVVISNGVKEIGSTAFRKCQSLSSIIIPVSVTTIGARAFSECTGLTWVLIGSGIRSIRNQAFKGCEGVTDVYCYATPQILQWEIGDSFNTETGTSLHIHNAAGWGGRPHITIVDDLKVDLNFDIDAGYVNLFNVNYWPAIFKREFQEGISSTICLPFSFTPDESIGEFYEFSCVNDERTEATMIKASIPLSANTPYLFKPAADGELTFEGLIEPQEYLLITGNEVNPEKVNDDSGNWTFTGTYAERRWDEDNNTDEIGRIYGFASGQGYEGTAASTEAGVFIRLNSGGIKPFRAYLEYSGTQARARSRGAAEELPERMSVRLIGNDGQTTGISTLDIQVSGEWYDLSGRKLMNEPTRNGVYIKNGRKIVNRK